MQKDMDSITDCEQVEVLFCRNILRWLRTATLIGFIVTLSSASGQSGSLQEYCLMETFQPRCTHGEVISMTTALFGRMRVGRCIGADAFQLQQVQPDALGCSADVLEYFDRVCSGKPSCDVVVPNPDLFSYRPCSALLSMYLEASYVCVSGIIRWKKIRENSSLDEYVVVDEDRSCTISTAVGSLIYIPRLPKDQRSNEGDTTPRCGSRTNPWIVEAQTGQQVKVSVLDFGLQRQQQQPQRQQASRNDDIVRDHVTARDGDMSKSQDECSVVYGYVIDKSATGINSKNNTICCSGNTSERNRFVYRSKGNIVEIVLHSTPTGSGGYQHKFLIGVEAVGCGNLVPPSNAWLRRNENEATVGCYTMRQRWHLRCQDGQWKGTMGQCHDSDMSEDSTAYVFAEAVNKSDDRDFMNLLAVITVSFIGLAVCLIIVFAGIGCNRRYRRKLCATKTGHFTTMSGNQRPVVTNAMDANQGSEKMTFRSTNGTHQYFILDKELSDQGAAVIAST